MTSPTESPDLEFDFMRYMEVTSENQRRIQGHYLQYFENRQMVLDLGCGDGDFVSLLHEKGINVIGVDSNPKSIAMAKKAGLPVIQQDVIEYLSHAPSSSFDAIFCAHLVEHLPYPVVLNVIEEAYRVLIPDGILILATPNVRTIFSHLEMFYLHFAHITFYHPRLLAFFLEHQGFVSATEGLNPETGSAMLPELDQLRSHFHTSTKVPDELLSRIINFRSEPDEPKAMGVRRIVRQFKDLIAYIFVQPYIDKLARTTHQVLTELSYQMADDMNKNIELLSKDVETLKQALQGINGPFESYVIAYKPEKE